ncbi:TIGR01777 family oxidoreductase [Myxococcota bacterium]|nr:TIGR01777 family oxidoreductase [Myxococcota bacterium]
MRLLRDGHDVTAWVRSKASARSKLGAEVALAGPEDGPSGALDVLAANADGIINLAGEPIFGPRWTEARKQALVSSRVDTTKKIVDGITRATARPKVLVSTSAVGFYGDGGDTILDERSPAGSDFLADLCVAWEAEAVRAREHGVRVAIVRVGIVLGAGGGALEKMLPPFKLGAGGPMGSGKQWFPWIHVEDIVEIFARALTDERMTGVYDGTAPKPVTNKDLAVALGKALGRPAFMPVPSFALKLVLGEAANGLLGGQRALPTALEALGFRFRFATIEAALADILGGGDGIEIGDAKKGSDRDARLPPNVAARYQLHQAAKIDAPLATVFSFFSKAENLALLTPPNMTFDLRTPSPIAMRAGTTIDYDVKVGPVPMKWRTAIERFEPGKMFVDSQARGPYATWWHVHEFRPMGDSTVVEDHVFYTPPLGIFGRLAHALFIAPKLREIFAYREKAIRLRFGASA